MLAPNTFLENPEKWLKGKLIGPEHLVAKNGAIFASLANGQLVKIEDGEKITVLGTFGTRWSELLTLDTFFVCEQSETNDIYTFQ